MTNSVFNSVTNNVFNSQRIKASFFDRQTPLEQIAGLYGAEASPVILNQVHSNICVDIDILDSDQLNHAKNLEADALVTSNINTILCIRTADCVPILIADNKHQYIAAIHAGWRGAFNGIIKNTVGMMLSKNANIDDLTAAIGPCIQQQSYQVDEAFYQQFIQQSESNTIFFEAQHSQVSKTNHYLFNLPKYVIYQLKQVGINHIKNTNIDTYSNQQYYSYRRNRQSGRQYSCILLAT